MEIEYRRDMNHNYIILSHDGKIDTNTYQVRMILSNDIPGFLPCSIRGVDGNTLFYYEITSRQSLKTLYEQQAVEASLIVHLYEQIFHSIEILQQFLLCMDDLILNPELIFLDPETRVAQFCFLPGYGKEIRESMRLLIEYLLPKIDHQNQEAVMAGYGLYRKIMEENSSMDALRCALVISENSLSTQKKEPKRLADEFNESGNTASDTQISPKIVSYHSPKASQDMERKRLLDKLFASDEEKPRQVLYQYLGLGLTIALLVFLIIFRVFSLPLWLLFFPLGIILLAFGIYLLWKIFYPRIMSTSTQISATSKGTCYKSVSSDPTSSRPSDCSDSYFPSFSEPAISHKQVTVPEYGETMILHTPESHQQIGARLVPISPSDMEIILLNKDMILLGKLTTAVDGILDSPAISRIHAKIQKLGCNYYLADLNSKNGTYLNGKAVTMGKDSLMQDGDEVQFANLKFRFTCS